MVKTKNKVIRTFCFYSTLHVICTKDFLKEAKLSASFDSVSTVACFFVGTKERRIPYPNSNPFSLMFNFVSCPNYTYEVCGFVALSIHVHFEKMYVCF